MPSGFPGTALGREAEAGIVPGIRLKKSSASIFLVLRSWTMHTPPPPKLAFDGKVAAKVKYTAVAASAA